MNGYGSHLPLFDLLFKAFPIKNVIEFGCGWFSTVYFLSKKVTLLSIEMQDVDWAHQISHRLNHNVLVAIGPDAFLNNAINYSCDLALVDGHAESRPEVVNLLFDKANIIVAHDFHKQKFYGWQRISKPDNYHMMVFANDKRSTACFIHESLLLNKF